MKLRKNETIFDLIARKFNKGKSATEITSFHSKNLKKNLVSDFKP
jgi:hypothetical protein